jgi:hypothetical protein
MLMLVQMLLFTNMQTTILIIQFRPIVSLVILVLLMGVITVLLHLQMACIILMCQMFGLEASLEVLLDGVDREIVSIQLVAGAHRNSHGFGTYGNIGNYAYGNSNAGFLKSGGSVNNLGFVTSNDFGDSNGCTDFSNGVQHNKSSFDNSDTLLGININCVPST